MWGASVRILSHCKPLSLKACARSSVKAACAALQQAALAVQLLGLRNGTHWHMDYFYFLLWIIM
jgi:hypothetical protein